MTRIHPPATAPRQKGPPAAHRAVLAEPLARRNRPRAWAILPAAEKGTTKVGPCMEACVHFGWDIQLPCPSLLNAIHKVAGPTPLAFASQSKLLPLPPDLAVRRLQLLTPPVFAESPAARRRGLPQSCPTCGGTTRRSRCA